MNPALVPWRTRDDLTLEELVQALSALLAELAPHQSRWAVSERPDARTVRYYTTRGMLPKPLGYDGGRARYGFAHLVRLLCIKQLQARRFTLDQIARTLQERSDDDVVGLVSPDSGPALLPAPAAQPLARADVDAGGADDEDLVLDLFPGGRVLVPAAVVRDPSARAQLADNLVHLARWLRSTEPRGGPR